MLPNDGDRGMSDEFEEALDTLLEIQQFYDWIVLDAHGVAYVRQRGEDGEAQAVRIEAAKARLWAARKDVTTDASE